jgi:hypothetical protein
MQSACQSPALVELSQKITIASNDLGNDLSPDQCPDIEALFQGLCAKLENRRAKRGGMPIQQSIDAKPVTCETLFKPAGIPSPGPGTRKHHLR